MDDCCHTCHTLAANEVLEKGKNIDCAEGFWPNADQSTCERIWTELRDIPNFDGSSPPVLTVDLMCYDAVTKTGLSFCTNASFKLNLYALIQVFIISPSYLVEHFFAKFLVLFSSTHLSMAQPVPSSSTWVGCAQPSCSQPLLSKQERSIVFSSTLFKKIEHHLLMWAIWTCVQLPLNIAWWSWWHQKHVKSLQFLQWLEFSSSSSLFGLLFMMSVIQIILLMSTQTRDTFRYATSIWQSSSVSRATTSSSSSCALCMATWLDMCAGAFN